MSQYLSTFGYFYEDTRKFVPELPLSLCITRELTFWMQPSNDCEIFASFEVSSKFLCPPIKRFCVSVSCVNAPLECPTATTLSLSSRIPSRPVRDIFTQCHWFKGIASDDLTYKTYFMWTLKAPKKIAADNTLFFFTFYLSKEIRLDVSCESSA